MATQQPNLPLRLPREVSPSRRVSSRGREDARGLSVLGSAAMNYAGSVEQEKLITRSCIAARMRLKPPRAPTYFPWLWHKPLTSFQVLPFIHCCLELVAVRGCVPESGEGLIANWVVMRVEVVL